MKIALITGASSGIGKEFAKQIAKKYDSLDEIWLIARRVDKLYELSKHLPNNKINTIQCDLSKEEDIYNLQTILKVKKPIIKILINSAGIGYIGHFENIERTDNISMCNLNCTAITNVISLCLPYMRSGSKMFNIASASAFVPQPSFAVYSATKSYVHNLSLALSKELKKRDIQVISVCPGPVNTEFFETAEKYQKTNPVKKLFHREAKEIVNTALIDCAKGKKVSVCGFSMKAFRIMCKIIPHELIIKFIK